LLLPSCISFSFFFLLLLLLFFFFFFSTFHKSWEIEFISLATGIKAFGSSESDGKRRRKGWNRKVH
jgi:hypothetical protein